MKVTLSVNRKHIVCGRQNSAASCPIALALIDKGFTDVGVGRVSATFTCKNKSFVVAQLSERAQKFIERFDGFKLVKPFRFQFTATTKFRKR